MSGLIHVFKTLDTVGNGSGTKNAIGDYSASPTQFKLVCPANHAYTIEMMMIHISSATNFTLTGYGSLAALTNGVVIGATVGGVTNTLNAADPFKSNDDWAHVSAFVNHLTFVGSGDSLAIPFSIGDFGTPLVLAAGDSLFVTLNDNFTGLTSQHFIAHGFEN